MTSSLSVLPDRGVAKIVGLPDDYLATAGTTIQGQAEKLERLDNEERKPPDIPLPHLPSNLHKRNPPALPLMPKSQSMPGSKMPSPTPSESPTVPAAPILKAPSVSNKEIERIQRSRKKKNIMTFFGR